MNKLFYSLVTLIIASTVAHSQEQNITDEKIQMYRAKAVECHVYITQASVYSDIYLSIEQFLKKENSDIVLYNEYLNHSFDILASHLNYLRALIIDRYPNLDSEFLAQDEKQQFVALYNTYMENLKKIDLAQRPMVAMENSLTCISDWNFDTINWPDVDNKSWDHKSYNPGYKPTPERTG